MGVKHLFRKRDNEPRHPGHVGLEGVNQPLNEAASIDDRIVSVPEPEEQVPEPVKKEGIISVHGQDVGRTVAGEESDKKAA